MSIKHPNLESNVEYAGAQSKSFSIDEMKNTKNFNKLKVSTKQQPRKNEIMLQNAGTAALVGGTVGATVSILSDAAEGDKNAKEVIVNAARKGGKGAVMGATSIVLTSYGYAAGDFVLNDVRKWMT